MELITYSFVLYLQHGRRDVKCKRSIVTFSYSDNDSTLVLNRDTQARKPLNSFAMYFALN